MKKPTQPKVVNKEVEDFLLNELRNAKNDDSVDIKVKLDIVDRLIKIEALRMKVDNDDWGSGLPSSESGSRRKTKGDEDE
jgi:hypothetical protein